LWFSTYGKHHSREAELLVEGRPRLVVGQQRAVLVRDALALGGDLVRGPRDVLALLHAGDVVAHEPERDVGVVEPHLVVAVHAAA
jgi:hypothetical protein